ncbi:hypothetical protein GGI07_000047 [Coemansia sp. Benny D115]|nr:hypothetical protein GGI07_000047 [Coemansia sp. Benny D115]
MFGPFVTRIIMLPQKQQAIRKGVQLDKHGLPKFDSILRSTMKDGSVGRDTELVIESPGLLGIDTRRTRVCVGDLMGSGRRYRTWDLKPSVVEERRGRGEKVPLETFTILWKSLADSPTKNTMREINNLVGSK